jgi:hypothetical protein
MLPIAVSHWSKQVNVEAWPCCRADREKVQDAMTTQKTQPICLSGVSVGTTILEHWRLGAVEVV